MTELSTRTNLRQVALTPLDDCATFVLSRGILKQLGNPRWVKVTVIDEGPMGGFLTIENKSYDYGVYAVTKDRTLPPESRSRKVSVSARKANVTLPESPVGVPYGFVDGKLYLDLRGVIRQFGFDNPKAAYKRRKRREARTLH